MKRSILLAAAFAMVLAAPPALAQQAPIKIAGLVELSGTGTTSGTNFNDGVRLAVKEINAAGGILGRRIEYTYNDTQSQPQVAKALAVKALGLPYRVVGISIRKTRDEAAAGVAAAANRVAAMLGLSVRLSPDEVEVYDEFFGAGYGLPTEEALAAIRQLPDSEGMRAQTLDLCLQLRWTLVPNARPS